MNSAPVNSGLMDLLGRWLVLALGVTFATKLVPGIECDDGVTLLAVVVVLSLLNAVIKPILVFFALPLILVTLGLGMIVINALLLDFVGHMGWGFQVDNFGAAVFGALVISVTNLIASLFIRRPRRPPPPPPPPPSTSPRRGPPPGRDDVIDI
jgi:putative membrane protein